jgi:hypothetical protein
MDGTTPDQPSPNPGLRVAHVGMLRGAPNLSRAGWERALAVGSIAAAAVAIWMTLRAGFLAYPGWLAVQKADFILGPILVGLYWHYKGPENRFGLMLIALGLLGVVYILESATNPTLFRIGVLAEDPIYLWTTVILLDR